MGPGQKSVSMATILMVSVSVAAGFVYRAPLDGDSCNTYCFRSDNSWVDMLLKRIACGIPCVRGQVINAEGVCVDREDVSADRCRDPFRFNQDTVNRMCSAMDTAKFADPFNCTWYYDCASFTLDKHVMCPLGMAFDDVSKACKLKTEVRCGQRPVNYTMDELYAMCRQDSQRMIVDTHRCNNYYICSMLEDPEGRFPPFSGECPYPQLLDPETKQCKPFEEVTCDLRKPIKKPCDLNQYQCGKGGHCRPCNVDHPDCSEQPDGQRPFTNQEFTPRYAECKQGYTVGVGSCEAQTNARGFKEAQLFHARTLECVPVSTVPRSLGGAGPDE